MPTDRPVTATSNRPALAIQGDTVDVHVGRARVLVTAVGPTVPEEGKFPVPATSPCTFVVTFARASRTIALRPTMFTLVDEAHHVHQPQVRALDGGPPPREIRPGRTFSIKLHAVIPTGDGGLEWAPSGTRPTVAWDFDVEID